jgi:hypothetical protein
MSLVLPFALQWSLGGFENSSAVSLWALTYPSPGARDGYVAEGSP